jgi:hypothetical protein
LLRSDRVLYSPWYGNAMEVKFRFLVKGA